MCGIAGAYRAHGAAVDVRCVERAAQTLRHRGPDGEGFLLLHTGSGAYSVRNGVDTPSNIPHPLVSEPTPFTPDLVLAHRRLAIIDLSPKGHEPMTVPGEHLWLTFNGEIYNYLELRDELQAKGYTFHTESDAEVLIHAYAEWGVQCLEHFIGMFAFALWDQRRGRLFCARDRFGVKPFYYTAQPDQFTFASEIKALHVLEPSACTPDMNQLFWFMQYRRMFNAPLTFFEGVRELPGAHYLLVENGRVSDPVRWWDVDLDRARANLHSAEAESEFLRLMRDSIKLRLRSDVPVGTCLSGGLDSSTIVALATEQLDGGRMNSFSSLYPVKGMDERRFVDLVAGKFNTIRHETSPTSDDFLARLERITWHQDVPTADATVYSQNFVMQLAQHRVTVLLDGQGADELFAGYLSHVVAHLTHLRRGDPVRWLREQTAFVSDVYPRFFPYFNAREFGYRVMESLKICSTPPLLKPEFQQIAHEREQHHERRTLAGADGLNNVLYQALMRDSIPSLLHYEDRNSMAYGIEARVPFLDHRLVEFALTIPAAQKVNGAETKGVMRRAMRGILPDAVVDRKDKLGYPTPFGRWLREDRRLQNAVKTILFERVVKREWINRAGVEHLWNTHLAGLRNHNQAIISMITAEQWLTQQETA